MMRNISVVIPLLDEVESLPQLHAELDAVARANDYELDIVFVDDGSKDGSWEQIERLASADPRVRGIGFRRNFGKAAALSAGFEAARGELVVTLDGDLQDDPREIPRLLAAIDGGLDLVSGWKRVRHDPVVKVWPSWVFNAMVSSLTGVKLHDHNCGMKCYRREMLAEIQLYGEMHRFIPVLAAARGWKVGEIVIQHRPRVAGRSKYGARRFLKGFLDLMTVYFLTGYRHRPLHLLGTFGLVWLFAGVVGLVCSIGFRPALPYSAMALLLGAQLITIGFLAELITANARQHVVPYSIARRTK